MLPRILGASHATEQSCAHADTLVERTGLGYVCKAHSRDTAVFWLSQAEPTRGRDNHQAESIEFFKTFPDNHLINHPYKVEIAQGDWTCTVADFTGTMRGPMKGSDGKVVAPTNKTFHIEFCTVAHWKNGEIVEEKLFYDLVGLLKQIGVMRGVLCASCASFISPRFQHSMRP